MQFKIIDKSLVVRVEEFLVEAESAEEALNLYAGELAGAIEPEEEWTEAYKKGFEESLKVEPVKIKQPSKEKEE